MIVGDLFSGIGGFSLAARWMGWETRWFAEIDPYCSKVLTKHWPGVPNLGDLTKVDWSVVEPVDLMAGGFPCQDVSHAGRREGIAGIRSGLWSEYARAIRHLRPRWVVVENVTGLLDRGMGVVLGTLAELRYAAEWRVLSAGALGAPHLRERVWIVAYPEYQPDEAERGQRAASTGESAGERTDPRGSLRLVERQEPFRGAWKDTAGVPHSPSKRTRQLRWIECAEEGATHGDLFRSWLQPEPQRVAHGIPAELDARHRGLGNAIVPQCAFHIFRAIQAAEERQVA